MLNKFYKLLIIFMVVFIGACADDIGDGIQSPDLSDPKWDGTTVTEIIPVDDVYEVSHANHLAWIQSKSYRADFFVGKTVKFINDIDMNNQIFRGIDDFAGSMDGNGKSINNLKIASDGGSIGLIAQLKNNSSIKNLTIASGDIRGLHTVGSFVGSVEGENISITNCVNHASVNGTDGVGGIIGIVFGETSSLTITNVKNFGKVTGSEDNVGGILGYANGLIIINNSENSNNVEGVSGVGGIIGQSREYPAFMPDGTSSVVIDNCSNSGDIKGTAWVGGIVGQHRADKSSISNSSNSGNIVGTQSSIGGIIGSSSGRDDIQISNSSNSGNITGSTTIEYLGTAGGIVGSASSPDTTLTNVYSYANVTGRPIGGIIGSWADQSNNTLTITNSYWLDTGPDKAIGDKTDPLGVSKLTADQFKDTNHTNFIDWDFVNTWEILTDGLYPTLKKKQ